MENDQKESVFRKHALKIIVPLLIIIAVGAIWVIKNAESKSIEDNKAENYSVNAESTDFALHVTDKLDIEKLKSYGLPIMIDFGADSCIPCKEMAPVLVKLNEELQGKAIIKFVDVWKYQELAEGYPISVIPTQVFFDKDGKPFTPTDPQASQMNMYSLKDTNEHVFTTHEGGMTEEMIRAALAEMGLEE